MCGGGTQTTTQQVSIPPEVMARYNSVNARAEGVANQPFQQYGGEFVAPLNEVQQQGIQATGQASQSAQPYYQMGTGLTLAGTQAVGPLTSGQISTYMNPYIEGVVDPTLRALQQQQGQQLSQQQADAIKGGAFGGERSGIQRAMLQGQQNLATGQAIAPLYAQGYQQAVQTATGQQGVRAQDLARLAQAGQQIAGLGTGAQGAALQGAQAQIAAGTLGQQTAQAQKTAEYQQFLQERGYPYQQAQFLANIAMGTGALSGSTTTTESPAGFFSDKRLKENVKVVGETNDGQPIYRYNYKGEKKTQLGLIAQEVEKDHPEAVGESQGYKTVDYKKATDDSVRHHRAYGGGLDVNAFGGAVTEPGSYAGGGLVDSTDLSAILAQQKNFFGPYGKGLVGEGQVGGASGIPAANLAVPKLVTAAGMPQQQRSGLSQAATTGSEIASLYKAGKSAMVGDKEDSGLFGKNGSFSREGLVSGMFPAKKPEAAAAATPTAATPAADMKAERAVNSSSDMYEPNAFDSTGAGFYVPGEMNRGGVVPRGYAGGGEINPYDLSADPMADVVKEGEQKHELMTAGKAPTQGSGSSGLGDAAKLASMATGAANGIGSLSSGIGTLGSLAAGTAAEGASALGALGSIGSGIASFLPFLALSDERMKHDKEKIGHLFDGQPVYRYHLGDGATQMGLLAQNVEKSHPEAVHETSSGIKMVNYDAATRDAANDRHGYSFGGMPRQGYADGSDVSITNPDEAAAAPHPADSIFEKRVIPRESGGKQFDKDGRPLTSPAGAIGIAQVMPGTAPEAAKMAGLVFDEDKYRNDPEYNKALGRAYFRAQYDRYNDPEMAMAAYNAGPGTVDKSIKSAQSTGGDWRSFLPNETKSYIGAPANLSMGKQAGSPAQPDKGSLSFSSFLPTQKDSSGKESTNWEKVLIPLLSGVGSALSSTRNTLGGALGEGLLGGIGGYQSISKMQAELPKIEAETQKTNMDTKHVDQLIVNLKAGLWDIKPVLGKGLIAYNKADPFSQYYLTDADFKPVPTVAGRLGEMGYTMQQLDDLRQRGVLAPGTKIAGKPADSTGEIAGTTGAANAGNPQGTTAGNFTDITKAVAPAKNFMEWKPVTDVPKNFEPPDQLARGRIPELQTSDAAAAAEEVKGAKERAASSYAGSIKLTQLMDDYARLPKDGPLAPGAYATARLKTLGEINDVLGTMGLRKMDIGSQAAAEAIAKGNFGLAAEMSHGIGTRVSNNIVEQAIQNNPSIKNSPLGFQLVAQSLKATQQYDEDRAKYLGSYSSRFGNTRTANSDFNELNKPEFYAKRAANTAITNYLLSDPKIGNNTLNGKAAIDSLKSHIAEKPEEKAAAMQVFDKTIGVNGAAKMLLGEF